VVMDGDPLRRWKLTGLVASAVIVLSVPAYVLKENALRTGRGPVAPAEATFVGREKCLPCHEEAYKQWQGSHHDHAMDLATEETVLGDFDDALFEHGGITARFFRDGDRHMVRTQGPDGEMGDFEITHTFGVEPLQQYLVPLPGGRLQALSVAWDTERGEWFFLYPDQEIPPGDWLHWTRGGQNWNGMCAECHSTNLRKGFDAETKTFSTTWSEIDVSCEACHGPGSRHVAWAEIPPMARPEAEDYGLVVRTEGLTPRQEVELCAPCHSRRTELGDYDHTHIGLLANLVPALLEEGLYHSDGQILDEVYVYGSFVQSKMYRNGVRCSDCHDIHSLKLHHEGNDLCLQCHRADAYDSYDHHFHKKVHEGRPSDGALCVACHMAQRPYMVIDWRADHSLRVPRPDLTLEIGVPNACSQAGCHDDKAVEWSAEHYRKWYGQARKPHYGTVFAAGREGRPEALAELLRMAGDTLHPAIVRSTALGLLRAYPGEESASTFHRALSDEEALVRLTAARNLGAAAPEDLVERLAPLLFDPVRAVRMEAAARLAGAPDDLLKPYQREQLEETIAEYQEAMTYSLDFPFAGHNLGNLYAGLGEPGKAEDHYRRAIEIDDLFYPAKVNLAMLLNSQGRNRETERLLREVLDDHPDQHEVAYSLGLLLGEMGDWEGAAAFLGRASAGMPGRSRTHYNLGLVLQYLGRLDVAEAALHRALELEPDSLDYLVALAEHSIRRGRLPEALALARRMAAAHPEDPTGRDLAARIERAMAEEGGS